MPTESPEDYFRRRMELLSSVSTSPKTMAEVLGRLEQEGRIAFPNEKSHRMAKTELQLLDELDEARIVLKTYRRGLWLAVAAALMFLAMILAGAVVGMWSTASGWNFGGQATLFIVLGSIGTLTSTGVGAWWFERNNSKVKDGFASIREPCPSPAARVRAAERAHRNHILEQS